MPPTGTTRASAGKTARSALTTGGGQASAGNSLIASAPHSRAVKASVGVCTPGATARPASIAIIRTRTSQWGMTISRPPAAAISVTWAGRKTVPAPTSARSPTASATAAMLSRGRGELIGTSMIVKPSSTSICAVSAASSGAMPRRIATSGSRSR